MSDTIQAVGFIAAAALVDATVGGAITALLQARGWDERAQRILRRYQEVLFLAAAAAAIWLLGWKAIVLATVLWLAYVEDLFYYAFLSSPIVRALHFAVIGDTQRVQTGEPDPLWESFGGVPVPWGYLPPGMGGWLARLGLRPSRRWACRLAIVGSVIVAVV